MKKIEDHFNDNIQYSINQRDDGLEIDVTLLNDATDEMIDDILQLFRKLLKHYNKPRSAISVRLTVDNRAVIDMQDSDKSDETQITSTPESEGNDSHITMTNALLSLINSDDSAKDLIALLKAVPINLEDEET